MQVATLLTKKRLSKVTKERSGPAPDRLARGDVSHELSTPQGGRASPKPMQQRTYAIPHGADDLCNKKHINTYIKLPYKSPAYLEFTALLYCVCVFASLPGTIMLKSRTNTPPAEKIIQTSASTDNAEQIKLLDRMTQQHEQTWRHGP